MGIYRPFVGGVKTIEQAQEADHSNDKPFTPADGATVARPYYAFKAGKMLLRGERPVTKTLVKMAATDMEGMLIARPIEKIRPGSGWGTTEHGAEWDTYADASALIIVGPCMILGPKVSIPGKIATGAVMAQEGYKASWALRRNAEYKNLTGERLRIPASADGKEAMAEKLTAIALAGATNDLDPGPLRVVTGLAAMGFAGVGSRRAEHAREDYETIIQDIFTELRILPNAA